MTLNLGYAISTAIFFTIFIATAAALRRRTLESGCSATREAF